MQTSPAAHRHRVQRNSELGVMRTVRDKPACHDDAGFGISQHAAAPKEDCPQNRDRGRSRSPTRTRAKEGGVQEQRIGGTRTFSGKESEQPCGQRTAESHRSKVRRNADTVSADDGADDADEDPPRCHLHESLDLPMTGIGEDWSQTKKSATFLKEQRGS